MSFSLCQFGIRQQGHYDQVLQCLLKVGKDLEDTIFVLKMVINEIDAEVEDRAHRYKLRTPATTAPAVQLPFVVRLGSHPRTVITSCFHKVRPRKHRKGWVPSAPLFKL